MLLRYVALHSFSPLDDDELVVPHCLDAQPRFSRRRRGGGERGGGRGGGFSGGGGGGGWDDIGSATGNDFEKFQRASETGRRLIKNRCVCRE